MKTTDVKTAKIYAFPVGGRRGLAAMNEGERADQSQAARHPTIEFGACWYHDTAISEVPETKKH